MEKRNFNNKQEIKNYVRKNKIRYFEDTSNANIEYERVKTRFYLKLLKKNIWPNISSELNFLSKKNSILLKKTNCIFNSWAKKNILINEGGPVRLNYQNFINIAKKSNLFSIRIIGKIIQTVGGNEYPPKRKKTSSLILSMFKSQFKTKTLGNVNICLKKGYLFFIRENRNLNFDVNIKKNKYYIFDGRFLVISAISGRLINCYQDHTMIENKNNPFKSFNFLINNTIPYLKTLEGKTIKPYLKTIDQNSIINNKFKSSSFSIYLVNRILI